MYCRWCYQVLTAAKVQLRGHLTAVVRASLAACVQMVLVTNMVAKCEVGYPVNLRLLESAHPLLATVSLNVQLSSRQHSLAQHVGCTADCPPMNIWGSVTAVVARQGLPTSTADSSWIVYHIAAADRLNKDSHSREGP